MIYWLKKTARTSVMSFGRQFDFMTSFFTYMLVILILDGVTCTSFLQLMDIQSVLSKMADSLSTLRESFIFSIVWC